MKLLASIAITACAGRAAAQPAAQPPQKSLTPQAAPAVVEADVLLVGCSPMKGMCGILMSRQPMALKVTKAISGPLKAGDTPVVDVVTCFPGPLLHTSDPNEAFVELDPTQIRNGSKIKIELDVYQSGTLATTDKITVVKL